MVKFTLENSSIWIWIKTQTISIWTNWWTFYWASMNWNTQAWEIDSANNQGIGICSKKTEESLKSNNDYWRCHNCKYVIDATLKNHL